MTDPELRELRRRLDSIPRGEAAGPVTRNTATAPDAPLSAASRHHGAAGRAEYLFRAAAPGACASCELPLLFMIDDLVNRRLPDAYCAEPDCAQRNACCAEPAHSRIQKRIKNDQNGASARGDAL
jgi:hypothetical protein